MSAAKKKQIPAKKTALSGKPKGRVFGFEDLVRTFRSCGLDFSEDILQKFWTYHRFLLARNDELDLTRIRSISNMVLKHYVDSALIPGLTDLPSPLLDIGTGAGFPGIPIKIIRPDLKIILAESRGKRLEFLDEACQRLGLANVEIYPHKVTSCYEGRVQGIITRDLEPVSRTLERAKGFLPLGGLVLCMKGPSAGDELEEALSRHGRDFGLKKELDYSLGQTSHRRRLLIFERATSAPSRAAKVSAGKIDEIASAANTRFKTWRKLASSQGVRKHKLALISGLRFVKEVLDDFPESCAGLLGRSPDDPLFDTPIDLPRYRLRPELFREIDLFGTGPPLLLVHVPETIPWEDRDWPEGCTLFVPFQDPANVGGIVRTAAALGVARIVFLKEAAHPFHPRSLRAAGPAIFRTPFLAGPSISELEVKNAPLIALRVGGAELAAFTFPHTFGLAPGLEGPGLPDNLRDLAAVAVPMAPGVESLNAAMAAGIALYEWRRARGQRN